MKYAPRYCEVCGKIITITKGEGLQRYSTRVACREVDQQDLPRKERCSYKRSSRGRKKGSLNNDKPTRSTVETAQEFHNRKLTERQIEELDRQQREIDRIAYMSGIEHYTTLPAISLPPEECRRLEMIYTPPMKEDIIIPHYYDFGT